MDIAEDYSIEGESSEHRLLRAKECLPIDSKDTVLSLLSDTKDQAFPIYRDGNEKEAITTVAVGECVKK